MTESVYGRVVRLHYDVSHIGGADDRLWGRVRVDGTDEVASLCLAINGMVAELQAAQQAHAESEARYRAVADEMRESQRTLLTLMSNLPGMAYRCKNERNWTMVFVSEGCLKLTGYSAADLIDSRTVTYGALIHAGDREAVWAGVQQALAEGRPFHLTYRLTRRDGEERWMWEQGRGVYDEAGTVVAIEGLIDDITDRKRADAALGGRTKHAAHADRQPPRQYLY